VRRCVINVRDALVLPGQTARLRARIQRAFPLFPTWPVRGAAVGVEPGYRAVTDAAGWIDLEVRPGRYTVCADGANPTTAVLEAVPPERELFVTDIDRTLSDASSLAALLWPNEWIRPLPGAAAVMQRLKDRFQIVYLTARNFRFAAKTKAWLAGAGFPTAPVLMREPLWWRLSSARYKRDAMAELAARFKSIRFGAGDRAGDARAYARAGARPFLIGASSGRRVPDGTVSVRSWEELEQRLL
jgi:hypothetical protein